jgi:hypothetical protein
VTSRRTRSAISLTLLTGLCGALLATVPVAAGAAAPDAAPAVPVLEAGLPIVVKARKSDKPSRVPAPRLRERKALSPADGGAQDRTATTDASGEPLPTLEGRTNDVVAPTATITVRYNGFTPEAQAAYQSAVDVIAGLITAPVPIIIDATWKPLTGNTLGQAGATKYPGTWDDNTYTSVTYWPIALHNQRMGYDTDTTVADITTTFNSSFSWYYGVDGNTPFELFDFKSVVMHEVWHGLGFAGSMDVAADGTGSWAPYPVIYDTFTTNAAGTYLTNKTAFPNPSLALGGQLTSGALRFVGANARRGNNGVSPTLYAPSVWNDGSSYSHLDEGTYLAGNSNSLMTPRIGNGESVHTPGPISLGVFRDLGWNTLMVPAQVAGVSATAGPQSATVRWSAPDSGGESIDSYIVKPSNASAVTVSGTTLEHTFTGLTAGTAVSYTVQAVNGIGSGPVSASSPTVIPSALATAPGAPTGVTAVAGNARAQISWTAPASNGGSAITGYTVTSSGGQTAAVNGTTLTAPVTGLLNGTPYTFTVKATNAVGTSPASAASTTVIPAAAATAPGAPTGVTAVAGNARAQISWTAPASNGGSAITGYTVTSSGGQTATVNGTTLTAPVTGLLNGTPYTFTVKATNAVGTSPASAASTAVSPVPATAPSAPTGVTAVAGDTSAQVSWTAPTNNGGSPLTGYTATADPGGRTCTTVGATGCTMTGLTNGTAHTFTVTATSTVGTSSPSSPSASVTPMPVGPAGSRLVPLSPTRVLDTRNGTGAPAGAITAGRSTSVQVTGVAGVPTTGVTAVVLNITAVFPTRSTFITAHPTGQARPLASSLNPAAGSITPNLVVVKVGDLGKIDLYNETGSTDLLADIAGYYTTATGSSYQPLSPTRVLDTRNGTGAPAGAITAGRSTSVQVTGVAGVPTTGVTAVVLNITAVFPTRSTFVTAHPTGQARPLASNLNPAAGSITPNLVVVKVGDLGKIDLYNETGSTDLLADIAGYYTTATGSSYQPLSPTRVLDTRNGTGAPAGAITAGRSTSVQVTGVAGVPTTGVTAVVLNITAVFPTRSTFVTAHPTGQTRPLASNLNPAAGSITPNLVVVKVSDLGKIDLYNETGSTDLLADIAGYYTT